MNLSFVEKLDVRKIVLYVLTLLFAYSISGAIFKIMAEGTLGSIFRHLMFTTPYLFLIILVSMYDVGRFSFASLIPSIPTNINLNLILKRYSWILLIAVIIGFLSSIRLINLGLLYVPVIIFVIGSLIISCYFMVTGKALKGIMIFFIAVPFLYFIFLNSSEIGFETLKFTKSQIFTSSDIIEVPLSAIFLLIVSGFFFLGNYKNKINNITKKERNFIWLCLIFVFSPIFSILFSKEPIYSFYFYLIAIILPFIYFIILLKSINTNEDITRLLFVLILSGMLYTFFALYWRYRSGGMINVTTGVREMTGGYSVFFLNPVTLPLLIPLQVGIFRILKGWKKSLIALCLIFSILYLLVINHRSSQIGILFGFIVFMFFWRISVAKKLYFTAIFTISLIVIILFYKDFILGKLIYFRLLQSYEAFTLGTSLDIISSNRISIWKGSLNLLSDFPLFGVGPGMYIDYMTQYSLSQYFYRDIFGDLVRFYQPSPHNLYLQVWLYYGLIAFITYMVILYIVIKKGLWNFNNSSSQLSRTLSLTVFVCLTIWLFMSFFTLEFGQFQSLVPFIFWTIIAIILKLNVFNYTPNSPAIF